MNHLKYFERKWITQENIPIPADLREQLPYPDQILQTLRSNGSRVSKATVYNTLNLLSSKGILRAISLDPTRIVYDSTTVVHHHFLNEETGELMDIDSSQVELHKLPVLPVGMRAESVELIIRVRPQK